MKWYVITCRILFDDEDSIYIVEAQDEKTALEKAVAQLYEEDGRPMPTTKEDDENDGYLINHVVECDTEPKLL